MNFTKLLLSVFAGVCLLVSSTGSIKTEVPKAQNTVVTKKLSRRERRRLMRERSVERKKNGPTLMDHRRSSFSWGFLTSFFSLVPVFVVFIVPAFIVALYGAIGVQAILGVFGAAIAEAKIFEAALLGAAGICLGVTAYGGYKVYDYKMHGSLAEVSVSVA